MWQPAVHCQSHVSLTLPTSTCVSLCPRVLFGTVPPRSVAAFLSPELVGLGQAGALAPSPHPAPGPTHAPAPPSRGGRERVAPGLAARRSSAAFCLLAQFQRTGVSTGQGCFEYQEEPPCLKSGPRGRPALKLNCRMRVASGLLGFNILCKNAFRASTVLKELQCLRQGTRGQGQG